MSKIPVWMDTDVGVDDAFAICSAFQLPNIEIVAFSAVSGNVELKKTFKNTRDVVALCGHKEIPVYKGAERPLVVEPHYAYHVHGEDGLGGYILPESKAPVETMNAIDALYEKAKELKGELVVVAVGPLTNIANAIYKYPDIVNYIKEFDIMGGSIALGGNTTPAAEFNFYADPHAAQTVMKAGVPIVLFPLDVTTKTVLYKDEVDELADEIDEVAKFLYASSAIPMKSQEVKGLGYKMVLHDTCPLVYLNDPTLFKGKKASVYIETRSELSLGRSVSDLYVHADHLFDNKNCMVMLESDRERIARLTIDTFKAY